MRFLYTYNGVGIPSTTLGSTDADVNIAYDGIAFDFGRNSIWTHGQEFGYTGTLSELVEAHASILSNMSDEICTKKLLVGEKANYNSTTYSSTLLAVGTDTGTTNAVEVWSDGTTYIYGDLHVSGDIQSTVSVIDITYEKLYGLVNNSKLVPGQRYRIIDFVTTTNKDTEDNPAYKSMLHQFDLIVTANTTNTLNQQARAAIHTDDTYFAGTEISKWQIWYDINNNIGKYDWAKVSGKGVIYRMIDEYGNDCPYDFKNIVYKRSKITDISTGLTFSATDEEYFLSNDYFGGLENKYYGGHYIMAGVVVTIDEEAEYTEEFKPYVADRISITVAQPAILTIEDYDQYLYTFSTSTFTDASLLKANTVYNNKIGYYLNTNYKRILNNNVFIGNSIYCNTLYDNCRNNTFASYSTFNTLYKDCDSNLFDNGSKCNVLNKHCCNNVFIGKTADEQHGCEHNILNNNCSNNTFCISNCNELKQCCSENAFGESSHNILNANCQTNIFGYNCINNIFGSNCRHNIFTSTGDSIIVTGNIIENNCNNNLFINSIQNNTISNGAVNNIFTNITGNIIGTEFTNNLVNDGFAYNNIGNDCSNNVFGNTVTHNIIGNSCKHNNIGSTTDDYILYNKLGNNCEHIVLAKEAKSNTFGNSCNNISIDKYSSFNTFTDGVKYIKLGENNDYNGFDGECAYCGISSSDAVLYESMVPRKNVSNIKFTNSVKVNLYIDNSIDTETTIQDITVTNIHATSTIKVITLDSTLYNEINKCINFEPASTINIEV